MFGRTHPHRSGPLRVTGRCSQSGNRGTLRRDCPDCQYPAELETFRALCENNYQSEAGNISFVSCSMPNGGRGLQDGLERRPR